MLSVRKRIAWSFRLQSMPNGKSQTLRITFRLGRLLWTDRSSSRNIQNLYVPLPMALTLEFLRSYKLVHLLIIHPYKRILALLINVYTKSFLNNDTWAHLHEPRWNRILVLFKLPLYLLYRGQWRANFGPFTIFLSPTRKLTKRTGRLCHPFTHTSMPMPFHAYEVRSICSSC